MAKSARSTPTDSTMDTTHRPASPTAGCGIQVVVRLRPMNASEERHGTLPVVTAKTADKSVSVVKGKGSKQTKHKYHFDNVFTGFSTQEEVFEETVKPVIADVMRGYESTVFAYGQTGTGKTHTMEGSLDSPALYGVIPRSAQAIFEHLKQPQYKDKVVTCSYLEIYNEELRDLLDDFNGKGNNKKMEIMEGEKGMFCRGLTEKQVNNASDVLKLMQKAEQSRVVGETKMNKSSSRSHCLFTIQINGTIHLLDGDGDIEFTGKLHMVDLAGSECAKTAGNEKGCPDSSIREAERRNINKSLLTLGRVITILKEKSEGKSVQRIPYRDSKLTRILQESLGGRCKTVVIATLSPSVTAIEESISTLNYAQSANGIINKPISSSLMSLSENQFSGKTPQPTTVESWQEMEMRLAYMQTQVEEAQAALARKHIQQQELQERADKAEANLLENKQKLYNAEVEIKSLKGTVEEETKKRKMSEIELQHTQINLKKTTLILEATQSTEISLTSEAMSIIEILEKVIEERNELHSLVTTQIRKESGKKAATKNFQKEALGLLSGVESSLMALRKHVESKQNDGVEAAKLSHDIGQQFVSETQTLVNQVMNHVVSATTLMRDQLTGENGVTGVVGASTASISSDVQAMNDTFTRGEESLAKTCSALKSSFNNCVAMLNEEAQQIQSSTTTTLQNFDSKITETKEALMSLVLRLKGSLSKLSDAKFEKTTALNALVEEWKHQALENTQSTKEKASTSLETLKASAAHFKEELCHHDTMTTALQRQKDFVASEVISHVGDISNHRDSLMNHCDMISDYQETQTKLCNQVMNSILSSVQNVVKSELGKLASSQSKYLLSLNSDGKKLAETNQHIKMSAEQMMSSIQSTNTVLSEEASAMLTNDLKASEQMQSTQNALEQIAIFSSNHYNLTSDYSTKNMALIEEMTQLDLQNAHIAHMVERDGQVVSKSLVNTVLKPTAAAMKKSAQNSLHTLMHVDNDVLKKANTALNDVTTNRKAVAADVDTKLRAVGKQVSGLKENIASFAKSQHDIAVQLSHDIMKSSASIKETSIPYFIAELDASKNKLISTITDMSETTASTINTNMTQNVSVKQSIQDFALNKMQCNKPAPSAPAINDCKYSSDLSSTPAETVIFEGHNFNTVENEDSNDCAKEESKELIVNYSGDPDTSSEHVMNEDDNTSTISSGSTSAAAPSPGAGLQFRDINVNPASIASNAKQRKHLRQINAVGASKISKRPSGLQQPESRKKTRL